MDNIILSIAFSSHLGMAGDYNNIHPRITYKTNDDYIMGVYHNSESQPSLFLGKIFYLDSIVVETGVVTGYSGASYAPMIKANYNGFFVAPGYAKGDAGLVAGYEVQF